MNVIKARNYEKVVADYISCNKDFKVIHEGNCTNKCDVAIDYKGNKTFIEVKLSSRAQFGSPRLKYENGKWEGISNNEITLAMSEVLNHSNRPKEIINLLKNEENTENVWIGYSVQHYADKRKKSEVTTNGKYTKDMASFDNVYNVLHRRYGNQVLLEKFYSDTMMDTIMQYYKNKGALFAQVGDNFYKTSEDFDCTLYGFKQDIPTWKSVMYVDARFTFRRTKGWIEILPTIKPINLLDSPYSLNPNSNKKLPYVY